MRVRSAGLDAGLPAQLLRAPAAAGLVETAGPALALTPTGELLYDLITLAFYPQRARDWLAARGRRASFVRIPEANGMTARPFDRAGSARWSDCILTRRRSAAAAHVVGVLVGEGIGPEVVPAALEVLDAVRAATGTHFDVRRRDALAWARDGGLLRVTALGDAVSLRAARCSAARSAGASVYDLRERYDLYCKVVPLQPSPALSDAMIVGAERSSPEPTS
jgi:hypothetical protein